MESTLPSTLPIPTLSAAIAVRQDSKIIPLVRKSAPFQPPVLVTRTVLHFRRTVRVAFALVKTNGDRLIVVSVPVISIERMIVTVVLLAWTPVLSPTALAPARSLIATTTQTLYLAIRFLVAPAIAETVGMELSATSATTTSLFLTQIAAHARSDSQERHRTVIVLVRLKPIALRTQRESVEHFLRTTLVSVNAMVAGLEVIARSAQSATTRL